MYLPAGRDQENEPHCFETQGALQELSPFDPRTNALSRAEGRPRRLPPALWRLDAQRAPLGLYDLRREFAYQGRCPWLLQRRTFGAVYRPSATGHPRGGS
jgi:hypothetical protein